MSAVTRYLRDLALPTALCDLTGEFLDEHDFFVDLRHGLESLSPEIRTLVAEYAASNHERLLVLQHAPTKCVPIAVSRRDGRERSVESGRRRFGLNKDYHITIWPHGADLCSDHETWTILNGAWHAMVVGPAENPAAFFLHGDSWYWLQRHAPTTEFELMSTSPNLILHRFLAPDPDLEVFKLLVWDERRVLVVWDDLQLTVMDLVELSSYHVRTGALGRLGRSAGHDYDVSFDALAGRVTFHEGHACGHSYSIRGGELTEWELESKLYGIWRGSVTSWPILSRDGTVQTATLWCERNSQVDIEADDEEEGELSSSDWTYSNFKVSCDGEMFISLC